MIKKAQQSFYRDGFVTGRRRDFDRITERRELLDDPLLATAYMISEVVIDVVGPFFWVCLIYSFFLAEIGVGSQAV